MSVFMTLIFNKPFDERILTFDEISSECQIKKNEVERFALKALAKELIQGYIDQVEETIVIIWIKPRALPIERIQHLKTEIDRWCQVVGRIKQNEIQHAEGVLL